MIDLNGIKLKNKFVVASGALSYGLGYPWQKPLIQIDLISSSLFGAVTTKTLTLEPRTENYVDPFIFENNWPQFLKHLPVLLEAWHKKKNVLRKCR